MGEKAICPMHLIELWTAQPCRYKYQFGDHRSVASNSSAQKEGRLVTEGGVIVFPIEQVAVIRATVNDSVVHAGARASIYKHWHQPFLTLKSEGRTSVSRFFLVPRQPPCHFGERAGHWCYDPVTAV